MTMTTHSFLTILSLLSITLPLAIASDPSPLQDFCIGVNTPANGVFVNGKFCKDPKLATADDFFLSGLDKTKSTESSPVGSNVTTANVDQIPGLNTLGISIVRIDYRVNGQNPPHIHPRATEILVVEKGTLFVGFVSSFPENRLFNKTLNKGDVFVFPQGLIHFQFNVGNNPAVAFSALSSQSPGVVFVANTVFGSKPRIDPNFLGRAFQLDPKVVMDLQTKF